jgi:hypothetical protein
MTERKLPPVGEWVRYDGGPRPVPAGTMCNVLLQNGKKTELPRADWEWPGGIVAFCVTEYPDEEETRTGECWAYQYKNGSLSLFGTDVEEGCVKGTCTTTTVNGKPKRIVWDADE